MIMLDYRARKSGRYSRRILLHDKKNKNKETKLNKYNRNLVQG